MSALKLFDDLGVRFVPPNKQHRRGPMETCAVNVVNGIIRKHGLPHATLTLRTIVESDGNQCALIADIIEAISTIIHVHPRWANLGLAWLEAFDKINLASIRRAAKATGATPLRSAVMVLLCAEIERLLGPSKLPKPAKRPRIKCEPKPPASLSRVPGVERNIDLGLRLLALRSAIKSNYAFGRAVRRQFDIDGQHAGEVMKVARAYGNRPEIYSRLSWNALLHLASPAFPAAAREALERRIVGGEHIGAPEIRRVHGALKAKRGRQGDQPAQRMAA